MTTEPEEDLRGSFQRGAFDWSIASGRLEPNRHRNMIVDLHGTCLEFACLRICGFSTAFTPAHFSKTTRHIDTHERL